MIKIIERGTIKRERCEKCGCLFSYEKEDIKHNSFRTYTDSYYDYIICPQCKKEIRLRSDKKIGEER